MLTILQKTVKHTQTHTQETNKETVLSLSFRKKTGPQKEKPWSGGPKANPMSGELKACSLSPSCPALCVGQQGDDSR